MQGYVYILTNPSFREDWVKIGKSKREVDVRTKELYNTALPLPFEIYATIKTAKYNELEANIHKILTNLAGLRISENREFFNIKPEEALNYIKGLTDLMDDAVISSPIEDEKISETSNNKMARKNNYKGKYTVSFHGPYFMKNDMVNAKMIIKDGKYIVMEGSKIDPNYYSSVNVIKIKRQELKDYINESGEIVIKDIEFDSPSMAASFVRGGASNGKYYWRTAEDKPLNDFINYY